MKKRQRKKKSVAITADGVKEIARMQEYITNLENFIWRMEMMIDGKDNGERILVFTEPDSATDLALTKIYEFIKEHMEKKENN